MALSGKIEESQVVRAAINLKKLDDPERLIKFVSDAISQYPNFATNTILIQNRARAKMDLAKKCINTGKDKNSTQKTKARAWEMCRQLLSEAERDLNVAYENTESAVDKTYLNKDFDFLRRMKENSRKPR